MEAVLVLQPSAPSASGTAESKVKGVLHPPRGVSRKALNPRHLYEALGELCVEDPACIGLWRVGGRRESRLEWGARHAASRYG